MTDIVKRLRWVGNVDAVCCGGPEIADDAADEIERLHTERTECEADLNAWRARAELAEARIAAAREHIIEAFRWTYDGSECSIVIDDALAALDGKATA
jgi:hypothetical protein